MAGHPEGVAAPLPLDDDVRDRYLRRLGVEAHPPSPDALFELHRAHTERAPWETVWIHTADRWGIDPEASARRIAAGRGGYCFHLNGAFSALLASLGYDVTRHVGGVHGPSGPSDGEMENHLVLTVAGLPRAGNEGGTWYVDVGLGDALHEPLPLVAGTYRQGPFTLVLEETVGGVGSWHLRHDPKGAFTGMAWRDEPAAMDAFQARHEWLSTSTESGFVHVLSAYRRDHGGADVLRTLVLSRVEEEVSSRTIETSAELVEVLGDLFSIELHDRPPSVIDDVWRRAVLAHETWLASTRSAGQEADADAP
jgi:arylamine N-acetyltransferase